jgi:hypothetical protein
MIAIEANLRFSSSLASEHTLMTFFVSEEDCLSDDVRRCWTGVVLATSSAPNRAQAGDAVSPAIRRRAADAFSPAL